jgi:hypothetical protein
VSHIRVPALASRWDGKDNPTFASEPLDDGSWLTNNDWFADAGDNMVYGGDGNGVIFINLNTSEFASQRSGRRGRSTSN